MIVFDFDGVIVDSEPAIHRLLSNRLVEYGVPIDFNDVTRRFTGLAHAECKAQIERDFDLRLPDAFDVRYRQAAHALYVDGLAPVSGTQALIAKIRVPIAIASGSSHRKGPPRADPDRPARCLRRTNLQRREPTARQAASLRLPAGNGGTWRPGGARCCGGRFDPGCFSGRCGWVDGVWACREFLNR